MLKSPSLPGLLWVWLGFSQITWAFSVPAWTARIQDQADLLDKETQGRLERQAANIEQRTGVQLAVLLLPRLEGEPIEEVALQVVQTWGLGQKGKDNGLLLLLAHEEKKVRFEVGYGLEHKLTDVLAKRIIRDVMRPYLRQQAYGQALAQALILVEQILAGEELPPGLESTSKVQGARGYIWFVLLALLLLLAFDNPGPPRRGFRPGGLGPRSILFPPGGVIGGRGGTWGGGGGLSGGGGGFGGGGASGDW